MSLVSQVPNDTEEGFKVDIICVPAIGSDPSRTWIRAGEGRDNEHSWLGATLQRRIPSAKVLMYDHLEPEERSLEFNVTFAQNRESHRNVAEKFASAVAAVADYGVERWADRFLKVLLEDRKVRRVEDRPMLFICHSTGGIVLKQALSKMEINGHKSLATLCVGVAFFATPHHGSNVLSKREYVQSIQKHLDLKWEMPQRLRQDLSLKNSYLEGLNDIFVNAAIGVKIYSYIETRDTELEVLTALATNDAEGEHLISVGLTVVDGRSARLSTADLPIEDEVVFELDTTHSGAPRFKDRDVFERFIAELDVLVQNFSADECNDYQELSASIMTGITVDIHQFYQTSTEKEPAASMKVWSEYPSLKSFFDQGPTKCLKKRLEKFANDEKPLSNGNPNPRIEIEQPAPTIRIALVPDAEDTASPKPQSAPSLPTSEPSEIIHTRRPSFLTANAQAKGPAKTTNVKFEDAKAPQSAPIFIAPSPDSDKFKWIHIPFTHCGWVPRVLKTISKEKADLDLHTKLMLDQIWMSQHYRSRHGSPHARFVRTTVKCLLPDGAQNHGHEGPLMPSSAIAEPQLVIYLPYLHWDSFKKLEMRARVIARRRVQSHSRPIDREIAHGKSMENKLIWQYLYSERPVHCRRTLDQYGYPSLRNTAVRDGDQILYKRTRIDKDTALVKDSMIKQKWHSYRSSANRDIPLAPENATAKVLMVDQLWLWILNNETVITFAGAKEKDDNDGEVWKQGDLRNNIYRDINGDYAQQCDDPFDFAALAVFHAIKALLDNTTDLSLQVFRIFEEYISILTERQTYSFKEFRDNHTNQDPLDDNVNHIPRYADNRADLDALLELRDIEDELSTMDKLFKEQSRAISEMINQYKHLNAQSKKGINGIHFLIEVLHDLDGYKEQVEGMLKSAQAAQRAFKELLDMKQKQANIVEAQLARRQTEVAADQSRSVMIFTIFTIIFLPLSFFASVFGINAREWSGTPTNPGFHTIFAYMGSISVAVIVFALLVAFNRGTRRIARVSWKYLGTAIPNKMGFKMGMAIGKLRGKSDLGLDGEKTTMVPPPLSRINTIMKFEEDVGKFSGRYGL